MCVRGRATGIQDEGTLTTYPNIDYQFGPPLVLHQSRYAITSMFSVEQRCVVPLQVVLTSRLDM